MGSLLVSSTLASNSAVNLQVSITPFETVSPFPACLPLTKYSSTIESFYLALDGWRGLGL